MKNNQKISSSLIIIILLVLVIILIGIIGFMYFRDENNVTTQTEVSSNEINSQNQNILTNDDPEYRLIEQAIEEEEKIPYPGQCLSFAEIDQAAKDEREYQVREIHNEYCGGDFATSPRIFNVRLNTQTKKAMIYARSELYLSGESNTVRSK